ncbi:MAG: phytanoyl-CoA dioxygenase family protein [Planctomycetota bacterium]|nr:phytanoyl-CoA dioxygenase family protein [Planctomycetota bacterium]
MSLTSAQIEQYQRTGVLTGIRIDTEAEAADLRKEFDRLEQEAGREFVQIKLFDRHFEQRFIWDIASHPRILDCVEALYGPDILLLATHVFCKYGPNEKFVAWHQDLTYWGLEPLEEVTAWYAIDDSHRENGCMQVIPRRHHNQLLDHGKSDRPGNLLSVNQETRVSEEDAASAIDCVLNAGEISLHEGTTVHGSLPNRTISRRCGVTVRYIPAHVRPLADGPIGTEMKWQPILMRGKYHNTGFKLAPAPFPLRDNASRPATPT